MWLTLVRLLSLSLALCPALFGGVHLKKMSTINAGGAPKSVVIAPDGKLAIINNLEGMSVWIVDAASKHIMRKIQFHKTPGMGYDYERNKPIPSFQEKPVECAFSNNGRYLWISLHNAGGVVVYDMDEKLDPPGPWRTVTVTDVGENRNRDLRLPFIDTGRTPKVLASSPDQKWIYVANWHSHNVTVIDATELKKFKTIPVVRIPRGIAFLRNGEYAYVCNMGSNVLSKIRVSDHTVVANVPVGLNPRHIISSPDSRYLYVSLNGPGQVVKFDPVEDRVVARAKVGRQARTIDISPDGAYLFVCNYNDDDVGIVDTDRMIETARVRAGPHPVGLSVAPSAPELWVSSYSGNFITVFQLLPD